ncbi:uncharacterized protein LJ206_009610 [Theristicus caerulescens]
MRLSPVLSLTVALCVVSLFPGGLDLCILPKWIAARMGALPEDPKQPPIVAETWVSEWKSSTGLGSRHIWVRIKMGVAPEGLKQPPVGAESVASDLPYPLGQLWDYLAQVDVTWPLRRAWQTVWPLFMALIALGLWRIVKRCRGQGRRRTASSPMGTEGWEKGSFGHYDLLCRLEANAALVARCARHVHRYLLKELRHQRSKKKVRTKARRGEPSLAPRAAPARACAWGLAT